MDVANVAVQVVVFASLAPARQESLEKFCPKVVMPPGFELTGGRRKFIVLIGGGEVVIAIGPPLDKIRCLHRDILEASSQGFSHLEISGGGEVEFTIRDWGNPRIKFWGSSGDFGHFDPLILSVEVRKNIEEILKDMCVIFVWSS